MFRQWRRTNSLNIAAALLTCGVKVIPISTLNERSGQRITEFHFVSDGELPAPVIPAEDPQRIRQRFNLHTGPSEAWTIPAGLVKKALDEKTLEATDPVHPALDALRGLEAGECLLTMMNRGTRYRLQVHPTAPRAKYIEGQEALQAEHFKSQGGGLAKSPQWTTADLAIASAVSLIGCPVLNILGSPPHRCFVLPRFGHPLPGRPGPEDAEALVSAFHSGDLLRFCPEHPFLWAYYARRARLLLLREIESPSSGSRQVFLHNPRSSSWQRRRRSTLMEERAPNAVLDQAIKHLRK